MCNLNKFSNLFMISLAYTSYFITFPINKENSGHHRNTHTKIISKTMIENNTRSFPDFVSMSQ